MKNVIILIAVFLLTIPFAAARAVITPLWPGVVFIAVLLGIPFGIFECFIVWFFVRSRSTWKWLWLPVLLLANSVSWAVTILFSEIVRQYGFRWYMEGIYDFGSFFLYAAVVFVLATTIEWVVIHLFRKKHGVEGIAMLRAIVCANFVSYAVLVVWFIVYAIRHRATFPL